MPAGRPSLYSEALTDEICRRLADGKSLKTICKTDDMPAMGTVMRWLTVHEEFRDKYVRAREIQADTIVDEILDIADDGSNDWMETERGEVVDNEAIQRSRLRIDARKWLAGKLRPKVYGEKVDLTHSGGDSPVKLEVSWQSKE